MCFFTKKATIFEAVERPALRAMSRVLAVADRLDRRAACRSARPAGDRPLDLLAVDQDRVHALGAEANKILDSGTFGNRILVIPNPLFNNLFCGSCSSPVTIDAISVGESHNQPFRQASRTSATSLNTRFAKRFCFRYNVLHSTLDCKAAEELCSRGSLYFYASQHRREPERSGFPVVRKHWRDVRSPCWRGRPRAFFLRTRLRKGRCSRSDDHKQSAGGCFCAPTAVPAFPPILPSSWNQAVRPALSGPTASLS